MGHGLLLCKFRNCPIFEFGGYAGSRNVFFGKFLLCTAKLSWKNIVIVVYFRRSTAIWTKLQTWFPKYRIFLCKRSPINLGGVFQAGHSVNRILSPTFGWLGLEPTHQRTILQFYKLKSISNMGKLRLRHFEVVNLARIQRITELHHCQFVFAWVW